MKAKFTLRNAVRMALASGMATAFAAPAAVAQDGEEEARELDRVQVTGSRIQRTDLEGALPVTTIDREQIELSGESNAADLVRSLSFNSAGSFRPQSGNAAQSFAGVSMRGLGTGRTLLLIDGKRLPVAPNVGSAQDLNSLPLAAIERIEVLSDGASAVYGSDAIGGVINVITRSDFEGAEFMYGQSSTSREGGETEEFSAMLGISSERGQLMAGVSMNSREIVWQRDRPWSRGGASTFSNNFVMPNFDEDGNPSWGFNAFLDDGRSVVPGDGCTGPGFFVEGAPADPDNPTCRYDFTLQAADDAELNNQSIFMRGRYDINFDWSVFVNANVSRVQSFGRYAPVPSSPWPGGQPLLNVGDPNHPATDPADGGLNPDWEDYQDIDTALMNQHRFAALGARDTEIDSQVYDLDIFTQGRVGDFDVEVGARHTESKYIDLGYNYVVGELAQGFIESGEYNMYDPFSVEDDVANQMIATISRNSVYKQNEIYANASTDIGNMPAGPIGIAFGAEYRDETYQDTYDSLSEGGQVVGSAGNSAGGGRDVSAAFFEALFPLMDNLEMNIAGRFDDYSDYGSDFSPKISFRYQPIRELTLRASYGEGFRAPTLDILTQQPSFGAAAITHAPTFGTDDDGDPLGGQITSYSIANPDLDSEQSEQFSFGAAFQPTDWFSGSIDYFNIEITNQITTFSAENIVRCLEGRRQVCPPDLNFLPSGVTPPVVENGLGAAYSGTDGDSSLVYVQTGSTNLGSLEREGVDINLTTNFDLGPGRLRTNLQSTYTMTARSDGGNNFAGEIEFPKIRATLENSYSFSDYQVAWNINFVGSQDGIEDDPDPTQPSWTTHDVQFNYYAPWDGRVTLGVRNAGDKMPPVDQGLFPTRGYNMDLYDGYGRQTYLRYTQNF